MGTAPPHPPEDTLSFLIHTTDQPEVILAFLTPLTSIEAFVGPEWMWLLNSGPHNCLEMDDRFYTPLHCV